MKTNLLSVCSRLCILALAVVPATTLVRAQVAADSTMIKHADRNFVEEAVKAGREEVAISQVAVTRATNPQVKEFAQMIVSDHTGVNGELTAIALAKGVKIPSNDVNVDKWTKKSAKSFDEDYVEKMISAHKDALDLFEKEAKKGGDPELTALAAKTVPALQSHLAKAQELKKLVD